MPVFKVIERCEVVAKGGVTETTLEHRGEVHTVEDAILMANKYADGRVVFHDGHRERTFCRGNYTAADEARVGHPIHPWHGLIQFCDEKFGGALRTRTTRRRKTTTKKKRLRPNKAARRRAGTRA